MSSKKYAAPLVLRPGFPWRLCALAGGVYLGALLPVFAASLPWPVTAGAVVWLALWGAVSARRFLGPGRIVEATWKEDDEWVLRQRSGREVTARLAADTFFRPWLIVLNFRAECPIPALVLFADEPDAQTHRRLRVRLRLFQAQAEEDSGEGLLQRWLSARRSWRE